MVLFRAVFLAACSLLAGVAHGNFLGKKGKGQGYNETSALGWIVKECSPPGNVPSTNHLGKCIKWSTGLEHETLVVHGKDDQVEEYVVNVGTVALQMARYGRAFGLDHDTHSVAVYLQNTGIEFSGRECAGINDINFKAMAESVSLSHERMSFDAAFCHIGILDAKILEVLAASPNEEAISKTFGEIRYPRSGASSDLGLYTRTGGKTHHCSPCEGCYLKDYTGSYHVSISLPHDSDGWVAYDESILDQSLKHTRCSKTFERVQTDADETPRDAWVKAHSNLANMIQWVEPLILAVFGSPDPESSCDDGKFVEGSYRTMNSGWGVPGTTDVRTFGDVGTGRYSSTGFDWMLDVAPESSSGVIGCVDKGMGSDIRTKSTTGEHEMVQQESHAPMDVGQGFEVRSLDNFPLESLRSAYRVIALLAEASRQHTAKTYVYEDADWVYSAQQSVLEGWNAILSPDYVTSLESNLDIDLVSLNGSTQAFDIFNEVYRQLSEKHAGGFWTSLLLDDTTMGPLGNPNRDSWELSTRRIGITPPVIREIFGVDEDKSATVEIESLNGTRCMDDVEDLVYLSESLGMVGSIETNTDGSVRAVTFLPKREGETFSVLSCDA